MEKDKTVKELVRSSTVLAFNFSAIKMIEDIVRLKCEEQREICSRMVSGWPSEILTESEMEERILNAQPPKI